MSTSSSIAVLPEGTEAALLKANLEALESLRPELYRWLVGEAGLEVQCGLGGQVLRVLRPDGRVLYDRTRPQPVAEHTQGKGAVLFLGLAPSRALELLRRSAREEDLPGSPVFPAYVVLTDPEEAWGALLQTTLAPVLEDPSVLLFHGEGALERFLGHLRRDPQALMPTRFVGPEARVAEAARAVVTVIEEVNARAADMARELAACYARRDPEAWLRRLEEPRGLRVLAVTSRFSSYLQYATRDLAAGLRAIGCETRVLLEGDAHLRHGPLRWLEAMQGFRPDLLLFIDHHRSEYPHLPRNLPAVNWVQDLLPNVVRPDEPPGPMDVTLAFNPEWQRELSEHPAYRGQAVGLLPLGINTEIYRPLAGLRPRWDVLYVSHLPPPEETLEPFRGGAAGWTPLDDEREALAGGRINPVGLAEAYRILAEAFLELPVDVLWGGVRCQEYRSSFVERLLKSAGWHGEKNLIEFLVEARRLQMDAGLAVKLRPVQALHRAGFSVRVYGRRWERYGLGALCGGVASNGPELNRLQLQSRICLNNSPGISLHMRAMEILGSGAFMLSRKIPRDLFDLAVYFDDAAETPRFASERDVVEQVGRFLDSPDLRAEVAMRAHRKAVELFAYPRMARRLLEEVRAALAVQLTMSEVV